MTAPQGDLDIRVDIAPDAQPDGDPGGWSWLDVSAYRRQSADIDLNLGRDDESSTVEPADSSLTVNERDGYLSPRNPYSDLYERIGQNTPIRYRLAVFSDDFDRTVGSGLGTSTSGAAWTAGSSYSVSSGSGKASLTAANTASEASVSSVGALDIDLVYSVSLSAVTLTQPWISAAVLRRVDANNLYRVHTELKPSGVIYNKITRRKASSNSDIGSSGNIVPTYGIGTKVWTRVQAEGAVIRARSWTGVLADEPVGVWHVTTTDADEIEGTGFGLYQWRFAGNTNVGTLTATIDDMRVQALLWQGNVPEWSPRWDKSGNDSTAVITAAGPLRRLGQGDDPIKSPLARQLPRYGPGGYWPLEDGSSAATAGSALSGGRPAAVFDVTFATDDCPPGASSALTMNSATSLMRGTVTGNTGGNFAALHFMKLPTLPGAEVIFIEWRANTGTLAKWQIRGDASGYLLRVYDDSGTIVENQSVGYGPDTPVQWSAIQLETVQNGGGVDWSLIWHRVGTETFWAMSGNVTGTSGRLNEFRVPAQSGLANVLYGHIWAGPESLPFVDLTFLRVANGYIGEFAGDRIERLCAEEGVTLSLLPGDTEAMGRQLAAKFLDLLRECAEVDLGLLYERANGLGYVPRSSRYNTDVKLTLDWAAGDLAEAPLPTDDDQRLRNSWTVSRTGGSEVVASSAASIARHGTIRDSAELNIATDLRLLPHAQWRLSSSTLNELRWPTITIDLIAHPNMRAAVLGLRPGSRIVVTNPKDQIAGTVIDLVVEGIKHTIGRNKWRVELSCSSATLWKVGVWTAGSRWGSVTATLRDSAAAGITRLVVTTTAARDAWSRFAVGYDWLIAGERVTVREVSVVGSVAVDLGSFEVNGITNWTATAGTLSLSTAQAKSGTRSALITVSGSPTSVGIRLASGSRSTVVAGRSYKLTFWIYSSIASANVNGVINWYAGASFLSSSGGSLAPVLANTWTKYEMTFTAPATATRADYGGTQAASPANGTLIYFDDLDLQDNNPTGNPQTVIVTRAVNGIAKTLPAAANVRMADPARWAL